MRMVGKMTAAHPEGLWAQLREQFGREPTDDEMRSTAAYLASDFDVTVSRNHWVHLFEIASDFVDLELTRDLGHGSTPICEFVRDLPVAFSVDRLAFSLPVDQAEVDDRCPTPVFRFWIDPFPWPRLRGTAPRWCSVEVAKPSSNDIGRGDVVRHRSAARPMCTTRMSPSSISL